MDVQKKTGRNLKSDRDGKKHETLSTFCMLEFKGRNFQQEINFSSEKGSDRFIFPFSSSAAL